MTRKFGKIVSYVFALVSIVVGVIFLFFDWKIGNVIGIVFIATGIFNIINITIFHPIDPDDERTRLIREKSGLFSYIILQFFILLMLFLALGNMIKDLVTSLAILLICSILLFPLMLIYINKKM